MSIDPADWGTAYNSSLARIRVSPDKQRLLIEIKQQDALDDHSYAVKEILASLLRADIHTLNVDHIRWAGKQRTLRLDYENVRVDFNILYKGRQILLEVKTHDTVLADHTRQQLLTLTKHSRHIGLVAPQDMIPKADHMLKITRLFPKVHLIPYERLTEDPRPLLDRIRYGHPR
ncbi:MAG: hypothetical protein PHZ19_05045 [Candidatus Thermoplasmatota archaeon]|nr:hypothetical protein [Candidatus Thermoplasmatota archaeon]